MSGNKVFPQFKILILPPPEVHFHRPLSWPQWNPKIDIWITLVSCFGDCAGVNAKHWWICCELPTSCFNVSSHEIVADGTCRACCCNVRQLITPMWRTDKCENSPNHGGNKSGGVGDLHISVRRPQLDETCAVAFVAPSSRVHHSLLAFDKKSMSPVPALFLCYQKLISIKFSNLPSDVRLCT